MHKLRKKTKLNHYAKIWHPQNTCKFDRALTTNAVIKKKSVTAPAGLHFCSPLVFHVVVFDHRANLNMWHFWKLRQFLWQKFPRAIQEMLPSIPCFFASNAHPGAFAGQKELHLESATHVFNLRDDWPQTLVLVVAHDPRDIRIHVLFVLVTSNGRGLLMTKPLRLWLLLPFAFSGATRGSGGPSGVRLPGLPRPAALAPLLTTVTIIPILATPRALGRGPGGPGRPPRHGATNTGFCAGGYFRLS